MEELKRRQDNIDTVGWAARQLHKTHMHICVVWMVKQMRMWCFVPSYSQCSSSIRLWKLLFLHRSLETV